MDHTTDVTLGDLQEGPGGRHDDDRENFSNLEIIMQSTNIRIYF